MGTETATVEALEIERLRAEVRSLTGIIEAASYEAGALRAQIIELSSGEIFQGLLAENNALTDRVRELEAEVARLQRQIVGHCDRIAKQSDLLSRRAEIKKENAKEQ